MLSNFRVSNSLFGLEKPKFSMRMACFILGVICLFCTFAFASSVEDIFLIDRHGQKTLILNSDIVRALELAKLEAETQKVEIEEITRYAISLNLQTIVVSLAPPYKGGLDGPEFVVEIRRLDFKVLSVVNRLETK